MSHEPQPDEIDLHVGDQLCKLRTKKGLSRRFVGEKVGVSFQQIAKYENGETRVSCSRLYHLAFALDAPLLYFFEGLAQPGIHPVEVRPRKSKTRIRIEKLATLPVGTQTTFTFGSFTSPKTALALVNRVGRPGWATVTTTSKGTVIKKVAEP